MGKDWRPASCLCCPCPQRSGPDVHRRTTTAVGSGSYMSVKRWRHRMVCVIQAEKGNSDTHHCKGELWTNPDSLRWDARNKLREKAKYSWGLRKEAHVEWLFPAEFQAGMQTKLCKSWGSLRPRNAHSNVPGAAGPSHAPVRISRGSVRKGSSLVRAGRGRLSHAGSSREPQLAVSQPTLSTLPLPPKHTRNTLNALSNSYICKDYTSDGFTNDARAHTDRKTHPLSTKLMLTSNFLLKDKIWITMEI